MAKYSMGMGNPVEKTRAEAAALAAQPNPNLLYSGPGVTRIPVDNYSGPQFKGANDFFPYHGSPVQAMLGHATQFPDQNPQSPAGSANPASHFLGKGAGQAQGLPNFGGQPNTGTGGGHLATAGATFSKGADKFSQAVDKLSGAINSGGYSGLGGGLPTQGGFQPGAGLVGAGAPRNSALPSGDPVGMIQQAGMINAPGTPGSLGFSATPTFATASNSMFGALSGVQGRGGSASFGQMARMGAAIVGGFSVGGIGGAFRAAVASDAAMGRDDSFNQVLGNDPFTQLYNYAGGIGEVAAKMTAGIPGLNIGANVVRGLNAIVGGIRAYLPGVPTSNEQAVTIGMMEHLSNVGSRGDVVSMMAQRPHTGAYQAARAASVMQSGSAAQSFEFGAFRTMGMMGVNMDMFGTDPTQDPRLLASTGTAAVGGMHAASRTSGATLLLPMLTASAKYLGLSPNAAIGQYADALAAQGFRSGFITEYGGNRLGSAAAAVIPTSGGRRVTGYPSSGGAGPMVSGQSGNAIGFSHEELIAAQYDGFTPTQVGRAFSMQGQASNLGLIGVFGGRSVLQQMKYHNLTGAGADRYMAAIEQMGNQYTQLGYEFGRGQTKFEGAFMSDIGGVRTMNPSGYRAERIEREIAALQDSQYSNFRERNAFGAYQRMDLKMGKSTDKFGASLFSGIKDKVIFSQLVSRFGLRGAMQKAGTLTPGQETAMLGRLFSGDIQYMLTRGAGMTHEETDVAIGAMANPATITMGQTNLQELDTAGRGQFRARSAVAQANVRRLTDFYVGPTPEKDAAGNRQHVFQAFQKLTDINAEIKQHLDRGIKVEGVLEMTREFQRMGAFLHDTLTNMVQSNVTNGPVQKMRNTIPASSSYPAPASGGPISGAPAIIPSPF